VAEGVQKVSDGITVVPQPLAAAPAAPGAPAVGRP
jgi:hypothetical protein